MAINEAVQAIYNNTELVIKISDVQMMYLHLA